MLRQCAPRMSVRKERFCRNAWRRKCRKGGDLLVARAPGFAYLAIWLYAIHSLLFCGSSSLLLARKGKRNQGQRQVKQSCSSSAC